MRLYRVVHLLANLGWVDFDLGCSTILPSCSASSANFSSVKAEIGRGWNSQNQSRPNPGSPGDGPPCGFLSKWFISSKLFTLSPMSISGSLTTCFPGGRPVAGQLRARLRRPDLPARGRRAERGPVRPEGSAGGERAIQGPLQLLRVRRGQAVAGQRRRTS